MKHLVSIAILWTLVALSCNHRQAAPALSAPDSLRIVEENRVFRAERDAYLRSNEASPFVRDRSIVYHSVKWYPVNPRFRGYSILHRYAHPETITVYGTKGDSRTQVRFGYFEFTVPDAEASPASVRLNVYRPLPGEIRGHGPLSLSVWFTDRTTGRETYGVGRYVDIGEEVADPTHVYTIDLNKAFNPYCAYSSLYSCIIPCREDHVDLPLRVGELKYHE